MASIDIDAKLRESAAKGKLWWHGTSTWHMESIKKEGLVEEPQCKAWSCDNGVFLDRNASMSGGIWARNAVEAAINEKSRQEIPGKGYPGGEFWDRFLKMLEEVSGFDSFYDNDDEKYYPDLESYQQDARQGWTNPKVAAFGVPLEDLLPREEYDRHIDQHYRNFGEYSEVLLVMDEDDIPTNCTQKFNGHWASGFGSGSEQNKYLRDKDGNNRIDYPYGVDEIPDITDEERQKTITSIESELIVTGCNIPGNRFYACDLKGTNIFGSGYTTFPVAEAAEEALET